MVISMLISGDLDMRLPLPRKIGLIQQIIRPVRQAELFAFIRALIGRGDRAAQPADDAAVATGIATVNERAAPELPNAPAAVEAIDPIERSVNLESIQ